MRNKINRGTNKYHGIVPFFILHSSIFIFLLTFILGFSAAFAQEAERITVDGSSLRAGESFTFTVTVNSDEMQSFADAQSWLTAVLCPQGESSGSCQTLSMNVEGEDDTVMRVVFTADALPGAGDYTLDVSFTDLTGAFAQQNAAYLITGVRGAETEPTAQPTEEVPTEMAEPVPTATSETLIQPGEPTAVPIEEIPTATVPAETAEPIPTEETSEPQLPTVTINVTLIPTIRDEADNNLIYGSTMYVGETYLLQIASDSPMNDSVTVEAAFPSYLTSAALDPASGCLEYLNAEGTGLSIPGSRWNAENGNTFRCELRFTDSTWLNANPVNFTISATGTNADETYELAAPLSWNYYPVSVGKYAATHQVQISDSRGNLVCSDTVPCSAFSADEIYTFTYKFPSDWGAAMPAEKSFSADITWPADWGMAFQASNDWETSSEFGSPCEVDADGITHLSLQETAEGRYSASCTFAPSAISNPVQAPAQVHLDNNSYQLTDLNVYLPGTIIKQKAVLTPSLTMQVLEDSAAEEQIQNGTISALYRTTADMPNNGGGYGMPALYTLKAQIDGVSTARSPQWSDRVRVTWPVLDALAAAGDLPSCLVPEGIGYTLGTLTETGEGTWAAECSFRFPVSLSPAANGGTLQMELLSGMYSTTAAVGTVPQPFAKKALTINLDVPGKMVLNHPMELRAYMTDETGGLSDYTRAVLNQTGAVLQSDWIYNYATACQGSYDLSENGEDACAVEFNAPTDADSTMHFELASPGLGELFNVSFRPAADIYVPRVSKMDVSLAPSLALQISPESDESEQINSGWISRLYRTAADMPNVDGGSSYPARYTLRAQIDGVYAGSVPQIDDYVLVNWNVLDLLSQSGDLPTCLVPTAEGYRMDTLAASGEQTWTASCSFYFPRTAPASFAGGALRMQLVSPTYQGTAAAQMNGSAFYHDNLYIDISVPGAIVLDQDMEIKARMYDDTGSLSDYARAVIAQTGASLQSDWIYNDVTDCHGFYDLSANGEAACGFRFYAAADTDSNIHFDLTAPGLSELFNISYRPGTDIHVAKVSKMNSSLTPSLTMRMAPGSADVEQITGGWIGKLYRTAGDMPNVYMSDDLPARYTLRANISGVYGSSQPQPGDYVLVNWPLLDALSNSGDLPSCITPAANGYTLGTLETNGEGSWTASCDFYFPQTMDENLTGQLSMQLIAGAYEGAASVQMNGGAFSRGNLYVDLDIPEHMLIRQMSDMRVKVSDDSGSLSEYSRLMLDAAGAALHSDWEFNYVTTCQGLYDLDWEGNSSCSALFEAPTASESMMHFELAAPGLENLFNVTYRPSADIHIAAVSNPSAALSVKLFHAGTEIPLPASADETFHVGEAYQLQFYLTPEPEFHDVLNAVEVDNEGLVIDWWQPLRIHWGMLPGGETSLNFYRDGDQFVARYDFSFEQGDVNLEGVFGQLVTECWIDNWDITGINNMEPVQLPARIDKRPVSLELSDFTVNSEIGTLSDVYVNQSAEFTVKFNGSLDHFDSNQLLVGYDANGIRTPIDCSPDYENGALSCSFIPMCTDLNFDGTYPSVCGTGLSLYAEYNGDPFNEAAAAAPKSFNIKRAEIRFYPVQDGSLSELDLYHVQQALPDLTDYAESGLRVGTWTVESFLPREIRSENGSEFKTYPIIFRYNKSGDDPLDEAQLRLDVHYQTGEFLDPVDEVISLKPVMVTDDKVYFDLDFGSMLMLDDGRLAQDALREVVTITSLEIRYPGSQFIAPSTARYEAENVTFALKVVTVLDMDLDISMPGVLRFGGPAGDELMMHSFNVYCSQLYQEMQCSSELPLNVLNENGEPILSEIVENGCWGRVQTKVGSPVVYVNNSVFPQCYLSTVDFSGALMIAGDF